eukprot:scaffold6855_cov114-Alexandrium_tamarense.AAC.1
MSLQMPFSFPQPEREPKATETESSLAELPCISDDLLSLLQPRRTNSDVERKSACVATFSRMSIGAVKNASPPISRRQEWRYHRYSSIVHHHHNDMPTSRAEELEALRQTGR